MPFCRQCGKEVSDTALFCGNCGAKLTEGQMPPNQNQGQVNVPPYLAPQYQQPPQYQQQPQPPYQGQPYSPPPTPPQYQSPYAQADVPSTGLNVLSFLIPIVGLILFIVYHSQSPKKAKDCGKWALIGFIVNFVLSLILTCLLEEL